MIKWVNIEEALRKMDSDRLQALGIDGNKLYVVFHIADKFVEGYFIKGGKQTYCYNLSAEEQKDTLKMIENLDNEGIKKIISEKDGRPK